MKKIISAAAVAALFGGAILLTGTTGYDGGTSAVGDRAKPAATNMNFSAKQLKEQGKVDLSIKDIKLSRDNLVVFRSDVNALSAAQAQKELLDKDKKLPRGAALYLYLDTPGGDIVAGNQLVDTAMSLKRPVHTITIFAASMGFNIAQRLSTRYILPSGTLMAHRATVGGVGGQIPGEFLTQVSRLYALTTKMEKQNAGRLGISFEEYTALVNAEYWVEGDDAVKQNAADALASVSCDDSLAGTHKEQVQTFFGPVDLIWANCPAVTNPLGFEFKGPQEQMVDITKALGNFQLFRRTVVRGLDRQ